MAEAFENMSEDDIDLAINVYNIADRHEIVLLEDEKIYNELVEEIANETGLTKQNVEDVIFISWSFENFLAVLKKAKKLLKDGKEINLNTLYINEHTYPLLSIRRQTYKLMNAIKGPDDIIIPKVNHKELSMAQTVTTNGITDRTYEVIWGSAGEGIW